MYPIQLQEGFVLEDLAREWRLLGIPQPSPGYTDLRCHQWAELGRWGDPAEAALLTFPVVLPNLGVPGTGLNVANLMLAWWPDLLGEAVARQGGEPMAACIYEYRQQQAGPDLLGYQVVLLGHGSPVLSGVVTLFILIFSIFAVFALIDSVTGGKLTKMFEGAVETVGDAVKEIVAAPFQGAAWVLIGGIGIMGALAVLLSRAGVTPAAERAARGAAEVTLRGAGGVGRVTREVAERARREEERAAREREREERATRERAERARREEERAAREREERAAREREEQAAREREAAERARREEEQAAREREEQAAREREAAERARREEAERATREREAQAAQGP